MYYILYNFIIIIIIIIIFDSHFSVSPDKSWPILTQFSLFLELSCRGNPFIKQMQMVDANRVPSALTNRNLENCSFKKFNVNFQQKNS